MIKREDTIDQQARSRCESITESEIKPVCEMLPRIDSARYKPVRATMAVKSIMPILSGSLENRFR